MKKIADPIYLVLEPRAEGGMLVRVLAKNKFPFSEVVPQGGDVIATVARVRQKFTAVIVRAHIGSFSASRAALVAANVFAATRSTPIHFVESEIETPEQIAFALAHASTFSYQREAHITMPT